MKNLFKKLTVGLMALVGVVGASATHAAADADLTTALASTTAVLTDNKSLIITFFAGIFAVVMVIVLVKKLIAYTRGQVAGSIGGGKRRR